MKIAFLGAGSTVFVKNVLGDCILTPEIENFEIALFDIDRERLQDSCRMLENINIKYDGKATINTYTSRKDCLKDAEFVINAIQVGGYDPCTIIDFEVPKKFGLRQTIGDTLGIGGIFRALRTIPVLESIAEDMHEVCPNALFINYSNPMAMLSGYIQQNLGIKCVGLCHSVQVCVPWLFDFIGFKEIEQQVKWKIAGINHQAWLLEITDENGKDLYPEIKRRTRLPEYIDGLAWDLVRIEIMHRFGYYNTESSIHTAEYSPYFLKDKYPELLSEFKITYDEYPRRCISQINDWKKMRDGLVGNKDIEHVKSYEYASSIIKAIKTDVPCRIHGNVLNKNLITNLPKNACVEVPCMVDKNGINPCIIGDLPQQLSALNMTNINPQLLTIEAAKTRKKDDVYHAVFLDPHTSSELSLDDMVKMCDAMFEAHKDWLPKYN